MKRGVYAVDWLELLLVRISYALKFPANFLPFKFRILGGKSDCTGGKSTKSTVVAEESSMHVKLE